MKPIITLLDKIADEIECCGLYKEAVQIDIIANTLEKLAANPTDQSLRKTYSLPAGDLDKAYLKKIRQIATNKGMKVRTLGDVGDSELLLIEPGKKHKGPNLLIVSGLHGEEPAGPFGLMHYLERVSDDTLKKVNLSFIPVFNPTGFRKGTRDNQWHEKTNRNFDNSEKVSTEGQIVKDNLKLFKEIAKDGMLTLHEDCDAKVCFIYMYSGKHSEELGEILLGVERMFFKQRPSLSEKGGNFKKGIVWDRHDGSLEDWLKKEGIPLIATTETPGKAEFSDRVQANAMLLNAFVDFFVK